MKTLIALAGTALAIYAETVVILNGHIVPVSGPDITRGSVVIQDGRIKAVGTKVPVPAGARKIDATGLSVYPGWIDSWSRVGLAEVSGVNATVDTMEVGSFNPAAQAWIAVNPHSEMIKTARVNGVTTALTAPSGGRIAGVASVIDLSGKYPDEMAILKNAGIVINIPSLYRASERTGGGPGPAAPESVDARRRRVAEELEKLKQFLGEAKRYAEMRARSASGTPPSAIDTGLEAMMPVMRGERPAICTADHFRDIQGAVALGDEFGLKIVIAGGQDAWKVADLLAKKKIPVLYAAVHELPRTNEDPYDVPFTSPELLRRAGVPVAIASGGSADVRNLPYRAAMAAAYGLEREDALKSITLWPAQILGISDKVGTIEIGKLANLIVARGDPLDTRTEIRHVFVEGREVPPDNRNLQMYEEFAPRAPAGRTATR